LCVELLVSAPVPLSTPGKSKLSLPEEVVSAFGNMFPDVAVSSSARLLKQKTT